MYRRLKWSVIYKYTSPIQKVAHSGQKNGLSGMAVIGCLGNRNSFHIPYLRLSPNPLVDMPKVIIVANSSN